jgi:hypothetical protein
MLQFLNQSILGTSGVSFTPKHLFAAGEQGAWYDPPDLTTLFQDSAGTIPVTAVEQPVGLILDKSGRGNHASQSIAAKRPVLSARYNLLLATETLATQNVTTVASTYTLTFSGTGTITLSGTATGVKSAGSNAITCTAGTLTLTVSGSVTQADLRLANDGVGLPPYQRVTTATDYDTAGFPLRITQDGVDDSWSVADGGGSTTAFFFCAAIRSNNTGATQTIWSDTVTNTGYRVRINSSNQLELAVGNGSAYTTVNTTATLALGQRAVITCWHDGATIYAQIDRGAIASTAFATASAGTSGFTVGQDNGASSSYFKGGIYGMAQRKNAFLSDAVRSNLQRYLASKGLFSV